MAHLHLLRDVPHNALGHILPQPRVILDQQRHARCVCKGLALCLAGHVHLHTHELADGPVLGLDGSHGEQVPEGGPVLVVI